MNFYIAYLLTKHECVIIPGLGAFVVSKIEQNKKIEETLLCPPAYQLGFNPEIKHNDGLLANTIAKGKEISYKESCLQIQQYVDFLYKRLIEQRKIQLPWVGNLSLSPEGKIVFTPSIQLSCNAGYFGLTNFYMPTLQELEDSIERPVLKSNKENELLLIPINRKMVRWTASVAAAVLALFLVATPLNRHAAISCQQAAFIPIQHKTTEVPLEVPINEPIAIADLPVEEINIPQEELIQEIIVQPTHYYYIVVASLPTRNSAEKMVKDFQQTEFPQADVVSAGDKHRIYVNKFEHKKEAELFLNAFRNEYPNHSAAWLLSQTH
jgi:nucleoid DNA-binding protein